MSPQFHNLVPLLVHGLANDDLMPSPMPICAAFSTISTFQAQRHIWVSDINRRHREHRFSGKVCLRVYDPKLLHTSPLTQGMAPGYTAPPAPPAGQEKAQGKILPINIHTSILVGRPLLLHVSPNTLWSLAYTGLRTASSTRRSMSTKGELSTPDKGK